MSTLFTSISECRRVPRGQCTFHQKTKINTTILLLIGIELFFVFIFAISGPFVSVFITKGITGGTMAVVGFAATVFLLTKSILQIPISHIVDKTLKENSIVGMLSFGFAVMALCPLVLAFSTEVWQVFSAQFLCGLGAALTYPSWNALFTHHIDQEQVAFEWSVYDTTIGLSSAAAVALGGLLIDRVGFQTVFLATGIVILASSFLPFVFYRRFARTAPHEHLQIDKA